MCRWALSEEHRGGGGQSVTGGRAYRWWVFAPVKVWAIVAEDGVKLFAFRFPEVLNASAEYYFVAARYRLVVAEEELTKVVDDSREPRGSGTSRGGFPRHGRPESCSHAEQIRFNQDGAKGDESRPE